jgi:Tfp pilus assembly protein PilF
MPTKTKAERQTATATRIARDSLRLAIGQLEAGDLSAAQDSVDLAAKTIHSLRVKSDAAAPTRQMAVTE